MSEPSNGAWPFQEIPEEEGLDISAIFGDSSAAPQGDPFAPPAAAQSVPSSPTPVAQEITPAVAATSQPTTAPIAKAPVEAPAENPIAAAFEQKTAENTKKGLLEKPPVFYHKGVKEEIDDPSMTFEELRIRKSDDFTDLEEGKRVSCFLSSAYVETGKLTVTLSEIDTVNAAEIINLTPKKRTLFGTLLASAFRSIWTVLTVPGQKELKATADVDDNVREAVVEPVQEEKQESVAAQAAPCATEDIAEPEPADEELNRIVGIFKLAREQGYTLKLIPGTPEENAPVFDFEHERILHNAA